MTKILRINNSIVDIDNNTSIGITFENYDIKEPGKRKLKYSNDFSIPKTPNNLKIIGFAGNIHFTDNTVYEKLTIDYWIDNEYIIESSFCCVDSVTPDRINMYVYDKIDFWDLIKDYDIQTFETELLVWLNVTYNIPIGVDPWSGTSIVTFLGDTTGTAKGIQVPYFATNLYYYDPNGGTSYLESDGETVIVNNLSLKSGHVCFYILTILEFLESKFSVNFARATQSNATIFDDTVIQGVYVPLRDIMIVPTNDQFGALNGFYYVNNLLSTTFQPYENLEFAKDKTVNDLILSFFKHFNIIVDTVNYQGTNYISLHRFDDFRTANVPIDWSGGIKEIVSFKPKIEGYSQKNIIKFDSIYENGDSLQNSRSILCLNENIEKESELYTIDAHIPAFFTTTYGTYANVGQEKSFETFIFFCNYGTTSSAINIRMDSVVMGGFIPQPPDETMTFPLAALISLAAPEFSLLDSIIAYPRVYEIKKYLKTSEIHDFKFFRQYYIQELGASFYVNKISGYNPEDSKDATTLELIQISYDTPPAPFSIPFYVDGIADPFADGTGDYYY